MLCTLLSIGPKTLKKQRKVVLSKITKTAVILWLCTDLCGTLVK
jgi:hypothetical protein